MKLILVRHGETSYNADGRAQGRNDVPLNEQGRKQALAVARALMKERPLSLYSSPLPRAMETAQTIARELDATVVALDGLMEADVGDLEGRASPEWRAMYPEFLALWDRNPAVTPFPGGEAMGQVQRRAWRSVETILKDPQDPTAVVVGHGFAFYSILCRALGMPLKNFRRFRLDNGSITVLEMGRPRNLLLSFNDCSHLQRDSTGKG